MLNELAERVRTLEALVASSCARKEFSQLDKDCAMEIVRHIYNDLLSTTCFSEEDEPQIEVSLYGEIEEGLIEVELEHFIEERHVCCSPEESHQEEECLFESVNEIEIKEEPFDTLPTKEEDAVEEEEEIASDFGTEPELEIEPEQYVLHKEDEYLPEMEEQVVYINNNDEFDASYFELKLSDEEFNIIKEELCEGDDVECCALVRKLNNFNDFDEAILYIQENYSEYNGRALEILAEKLTDKLV